MNKEEWSTALEIKKKIQRLQDRLVDLRETGGVGCSSGKESGFGGIRVVIGDIVVDISDEIKELQKELEVEQKIIRESLQEMELGEMERRLMELRYIEGWKWDPIVAVLCYSRRWVLQTHANIMKNNLECA